MQTPLSDADILDKTNEILAFCELQPRFSSIFDIQENSSSICVAILERLLQQKLSEINRNPKCSTDYIQNAEIFISNLKTGFLKINLPNFVTPKAVCDGDKGAISEILNVLSKLVTLLKFVRTNRSLQASKEPIIADSISPHRRPNYDADVDDISDTSISHQMLSSNSKQIKDISTTCTDMSMSSNMLSSSVATTTSMETDEADRSPIYRPDGFRYENVVTDSPSTYSLKKQKKKKKSKKTNKQKLQRPMSAKVRSLSTTPSIYKQRKVAKKKNDKQIYKQILHHRFSLMNKSDKMSKLKKKQSKIKNAKKNKKMLNEDRLIHIVRRQQKEKTRSDLRWLERMENKLERELILRTIKQKSDEEVAIERVQSEAKKLEKEYLRSYYNEYKKKFEILRKDLETKTKSIQHFFKDQYSVLDEEKETIQKFNHSQNYSNKMELTKLKKELKSKKESKLNELCQMISTLNLNDQKDLGKLNKMIKNMVKSR